MDKKTKKMVATEAEITECVEKLGEVNGLFGRTEKFEARGEDGKKAKGEALARLGSARDQLQNNIRVLQARLEVETVAMLAGDDFDFAEPTPTDALRNAS